MAVANQVLLWSPGAGPTKGGPAMSNCFAAKTDSDLLSELTQEIDTIRLLGPEDQWRIVAMARGLSERGMALPFILAGVRSSAEVLVDLEETGSDPVMTRPEVRRFLEENVPPTSRTAVFRGNDP